MAEIVTRTLGCGMPLILEQMSGVRSAGVTWLLPAGSATDPAGLEGLSTMWSELALRGAGELSSRAQADVFDALGASRSVDVATMHLRLGSTLLGVRLLQTLARLSDIVRWPRMEEEGIEPTRDLALQSLEGLKDDPQERAVIELKRRHMAAPVNRSGMGTEEGLKAITRHDLVEGWARQVKPKGAARAGEVGTGSILAIAGDLESAGGVEAIVGELDGFLSGWEGEAPAIVKGEAKERGTQVHVEDPSAQVQVVLMHEAPAEKSAESALERVVSSVLSGGMSSRLFSEVREKRALCYAVSASYAADKEDGRVLGYVGTTPERAQESLKVMKDELERINTPEGKITKDEFDRAMIGIRSSLIMSGESTSSRAGALAGDWYRLGRARSLEEVAKKYAAITLDEVNAYLAKRKLGAMTVVTLGPKG